MTANWPVPHSPQPPVANVIYAYPISPPPPQGIGDATRIVQNVLAIVAEMGDRLQAATRQPYPCAVCTIDTATWSDWQRRRHFNSHTLADRARVIGWFRAVIG